MVKIKKAVAKAKKGQSQQQKTKKSVGGQQMKANVKKLPNVGRHAESEDCRKYQLALTNPFSEAANGSRVPDEYAYPTTTFTFRPKFTVGTDSSGNFDFCIYPNMRNFVQQFRGTFNGPTSIAAVPTSLYNYRIVGYGLKWSWMIPQTAVSGQVSYAMVPSCHYVHPSGVSVGGITGTGAGETAFTNYEMIRNIGLPTDSNNGWLSFNGLSQLPLSGLETTVNSYGKTVTMVGRMSGPEAFHFRQSADRKGGYDVVNQTTSSYLVSGDASYLSAHGWSTFAFAGIGLPASTVIGQVELVFHIEGSPSTTLGVTGVTDVIPDSSELGVFADPVALGRIIAKAVNTPWVKLAVDTARTVVAML